MFVRPLTIRHFCKIAIPRNTATTSATSSSSLLLCKRGGVVLCARNNSQRIVVSRNFSSKEDSTKKTTGNEEEDMTKEIVLTPGQKVVAGTRLTMWAGIAVFASVCAYYIGKELIPTKMSPNTVFNNASSIVRKNADVTRRFGTPIKVYGRDHGGHREGRRNFIE